MVGLKAPPHGEMMDNNGKPIYFDGIDNTAYVTGKAKHSARNGWIYIDGENFSGVRADIALDRSCPFTKADCLFDLRGNRFITITLKQQKRFCRSFICRWSIRPRRSVRKLI
jgi:hypothetical protein